MSTPKHPAHNCGSPSTYSAGAGTDPRKNPKRGSLDQFQDTRSLAKIARDPNYLLLGVRRLIFLLTTHRYIGGPSTPIRPYLGSGCKPNLGTAVPRSVGFLQRLTPGQYSLLFPDFIFIRINLIISIYKLFCLVLQISIVYIVTFTKQKCCYNIIMHYTETQ